MAFTIGVDYGTNSVRAIVVDCSDGREIGSCVVEYPTGKHGVLLEPRDHHLARQHPGAGSSQRCALGSAISAAVPAGESAGGYADFQIAQKRMTSLNPVEYRPIRENDSLYNRLYRLYRQLHDAFGGANKSADRSSLMKELIGLQTLARTEPRPTELLNYVPPPWNLLP